MVIDLAKPGGATSEDVRALIASRDDSEHRQLRISQTGKAYLSDLVGAEGIDGLHCRFETWVAGNGYSGQEAADDDKYVEEIRDDLNSNWPEAKDSYIDW